MTEASAADGVTDAECGTLIGVGAIIARIGKTEMKAEIEAIMAIGRARARP